MSTRHRRGHRGDHTRRPLASLCLALSSTTISTLPVFLFGAFAIFVRHDLDFSHTQVGITAAAFYGTSSVASVLGGRIAHRLGPERSMAIGGLTSALGLLGVALLAYSWVHIAVLLGFAGLGNALAQPAANALVARDQPARYRGLGFGVLQSAIPLATLLAGLVVPLIALNLSWRWGFVGAAVIATAVVIIIIVSSRRHADATSIAAQHTALRPEHHRIEAMGSLYLLAVAGGLAAAAGNVLGAFYVESVAAAGVPIGVAGLLLVMGSCCGISGRLIWGWGADRWINDPLRFVIILLLVGVVGFLAIGLVNSVAVTVLATVLAFGAGWAWKGLYNLSVIQLSPRAPSVALGISQSGVFAGSVAGPLGFGLILDLTSYATAWTITALTLAGAAVMIMLERRLAHRRDAA